MSEDLNPMEARVVSFLRRIKQQEAYVTLELQFQKGNFERALIHQSYTSGQFVKPYMGTTEVAP